MIFRRLNSSKLVLGLVAALVIVSAATGFYAYHKYHVSSMYGRNPVGAVSIDSKKIPSGWAANPDNSKTQVGLGMDFGNGGSILLQKVSDSTMQYKDAKALSAKLREQNPQKMTRDGYEIRMRQPSSIVIMTSSGKVRLPTVEWTEVAPFRISSSTAYYVQDGYYISVERTVHTDYSTKLTPEELLAMTDAGLPAIKISN